jgi:hypothetical protein
MSDATAHPLGAAPISNADVALAHAWAATAPGRDKWSIEHVQCGPRDDDATAEWFTVEYPGHDRVVAGYQPGFTILPTSSGWELQDEGRDNEHYRTLPDALFAICPLARCQEQVMHALAANWLARGTLRTRRRE